MKRMPRRVFTQEFKAEAIKLMQKGELTQSEVAKKPCIAAKTLRTWMADDEAG